MSQLTPVRPEVSESGFERLHLRWRDEVPGPDTALLRRHKAGLPKDFQMMADRRLGTARGSDQVADAHTRRAAGGDHRKKMQPHRIGQCLETFGQVDGIFLVEFAASDGFAALGHRYRLTRHLVSGIERIRIDNDRYVSKDQLIDDCR